MMANSSASNDPRNLTYLIILGILFGITAFDTLLLGFAIPDLIPKYNLSHSQAGLLGTGLMIGIGLGALIFGALSDFTGRKRVIYISVTIFSISTGMMAFNQTYFWLLFLLFVAGLGLGGSLTMTIATLPDLIKENLDKYMCYIESFWGFGALLVVSVFYLKVNLGQLFIAGFIPLLTLPLFYLLPDIKSDVKSYAESYSRSIRFTQSNSNSNSKKNISGNISDLFYKYGKLTALLWIIWFCGVYTYYGVFLWLPEVVVSSRYEISVLISVSIPILIPVYGIQIISPLLLSFIAREGNTERLLVIYSFFAALATLIFIFSRSAILTISGMIILSFLSIGGWVLLILLTQKSYPTNIRGLGVGSAASVGRIGGILAPYLTGYFMDVYGSYTFPFSVFATLFLLIAFLSLPVSRIRHRI